MDQHPNDDDSWSNIGPNPPHRPKALPIDDCSLTPPDSTDNLGEAARSLVSQPPLIPSEHTSLLRPGWIVFSGAYLTTMLVMAFTSINATHNRNETTSGEASILRSVTESVNGPRDIFVSPSVDGKEKILEVQSILSTPVELEVFERPRLDELNTDADKHDGREPTVTLKVPEDGDSTMSSAPSYDEEVSRTKSKVLGEESRRRADPRVPLLPRPPARF